MNQEFAGTCQNPREPTPNHNLMKSIPLIDRSRRVAIGLSLTLAALGTAPAEGAIVSDFDDGVPDWDESVLRGVTFTESGGHLVATGNIPAKTDCVTWNLSSLRWFRPVALKDGEVFELRVDLLESEPNDVQALLTYVEPGVGGYSLVKDRDEIWLTKFRWVDCGANAPFFYEQILVKNERVRLVLEFRKAGTSLHITSKVIDLDGMGYPVVFERTVTDTTGVDPTVPSFRGFTWSPDAGAPFFNGTAVAVDVLSVADSAVPGARVVFDNLAYEPRPVLEVEKAVRLSWPAHFEGVQVLGAPTLDGPWTTISEPILKSNGSLLMTVPAPLSSTLRFFRLD